MTDRLEEIRVRHAAATRGPWHPCPQKSFIFGPNHEMIAGRLRGDEDGVEDGTVEIRGFGGGLPMDANHDFIVESWADIRWLLERVGMLKATAEQGQKGETETINILGEALYGPTPEDAPGPIYACEIPQTLAEQAAKEIARLRAELAARDATIAERTRERDVAQADAVSFMHGMHAAEKCVTSDQRYEAGFDVGFTSGREGRANTIAELTLRAEAAERRVAWQPIETIPKTGGDPDDDGPYVLLRIVDSGDHVRCSRGYWRGDYECVAFDEDWGDEQPTHWMSLPSTDVTEPAGGDDESRS